jgi:predicted nucleic acid-binding protein
LRDDAARLVIDASAVVALLTDRGEAGAWVAGQVRGRALVAPHLMPFETANILRRLEIAGVVDSTTASLAHADLAALAIDLVPWHLLADRAWELRGNVTIYDATYVALAESLDVPLLTLDQRISRAPGIDCEIQTPTFG